VGVAGPLPACSPLPPRQLPKRKAVLCVDLEYILLYGFRLYTSKHERETKFSELGVQAS